MLEFELIHVPSYTVIQYFNTCTDFNTVAKTMFLNNAHRTLHHSCILGMLTRI